MQIFKHLNIIIFILLLCVPNVTEAAAAVRPIQEIKRATRSAEEIKDLVTPKFDCAFDAWFKQKTDPNFPTDLSKIIRECYAGTEDLCSPFVTGVKRTQIAIDKHTITCVAKFNNKRLLIGTAKGKLFLYNVNTQTYGPIKTDLRAEKINAVMLYKRYFVVSYLAGGGHHIALIEVPSGVVVVTHQVPEAFDTWVAYPFRSITALCEYNGHIIAGHTSNIVSSWYWDEERQELTGNKLCDLGYSEWVNRLYLFRHNNDCLEIFLKEYKYPHSISALSYDNKELTPMTIPNSLIFPMGFKHILKVYQQGDVIVHEDEPERVIALVGSSCADNRNHDKIVRVIPLDSGRVVVEKTNCGCLSNGIWELLELTFADPEEAILSQALSECNI